MPPVPSKSRSAVIDEVDPAHEGALLPSLSRRAGTAQAGSPPEAHAGETSASRGRARKLFSLDDEEGEGDLSDSEERAGRDALASEKRGSRKEAAPGSHMAQETVDPEQEQQRAERVRRYHALMELLTTEVGYLLDLRTLVAVRSQQYSLL